MPCEQRLNSLIFVIFRGGWEIRKEPKFDQTWQKDKKLRVANKDQFCNSCFEIDSHNRI